MNNEGGEVLTPATEGVNLRNPSFLIFWGRGGEGGGKPQAVAKRQPPSRPWGVSCVGPRACFGAARGSPGETSFWRNGGDDAHDARCRDEGWGDAPYSV